MLHPSANRAARFSSLPSTRLSLVLLVEGAGMNDMYKGENVPLFRSFSFLFLLLVVVVVVVQTLFPCIMHHCVQVMSVPAVLLVGRSNNTLVLNTCSSRNESDRRRLHRVFSALLRGHKRGLSSPCLQTTVQVHTA